MSSKPGLIELALHLTDPRELFVFDPAAYDPLAPDALAESGIEYLLAQTSGPSIWRPTPRRLRATVYVPRDRLTPDLAPRLRTALAAHCARQIARSRRAQAELVIQSLVRLAFAALLVLLALALQALIGASTLPGGQLVKPALELGTDVLAWVALWTPIDALVTDWLSFFRLRRGYRVLRGMELTVEADD